MTHRRYTVWGSLIVFLSLGSQFALPAAQAKSPQWKFTTVAQGLDTPWELVFLPSKAMLITERKGRIIWAFKGRQKTWLDLRRWPQPKVSEWGEGGLMGLAIDPLFQENHYLYTVHTYVKSGQSYYQLVRLKADLKRHTGAFDRVLISGVKAGRFHNGGRLAFGPDGKLYWTLGDLFQRSRAQKKADLHGKVLRLNRDGSTPADNPFGSRVYSLGHRNPQGLAWDNQGRLFVTEHGPSGEKGCCQDELNRVQKGFNYGWPLISGAERKQGLVSPLVQSGKHTTWAPGGLAYLKQGLWKNSLVFTGLKGEAIYRVKLPQNGLRLSVPKRYLHKRFGRLRQVVEGPLGKLYILTSNRDGRYGKTIKKMDDRIIQIQIKG